MNGVGCFRFQVLGPWAAFSLPQSFCLTGSAGDGETGRETVCGGLLLLTVVERWEGGEFRVVGALFLVLGRRNRMQSGGTFDCWGSHFSASLFLPERVLVFLREKGGGWGDGAGIPRLRERCVLGSFRRKSFCGMGAGVPRPKIDQAFFFWVPVFSPSAGGRGCLQGVRWSCVLDGIERLFLGLASEL